jgi:hypothetical protein
MPEVLPDVRRLNNPKLVDQVRRLLRLRLSACDSFKFQKRCRFFVGGNDKSLSVITVCVATKIVRWLESTVETQPQLQPALLRLSAIISQYFIRGDSELAMDCHDHILTH